MTNDTSPEDRAAEEESNRAREITGQLLKHFQISRVVLIDDEVSDSALRDEVLQLGTLLSPEEREDAGIQAGLERSLAGDDWDVVLIEEIGETDWSPIRELFRQKAKVPVEVDEPETFSSLRALLGDTEFIPLSPTGWNQRGEGLVLEASTNATLFLFDKDLGEAGDGSRIAANETKKKAEGARFCVLTAKTTPKDEFADWTEQAKNLDVSEGDLGLVSKEHLINDLIGFPRMLKMSLAYQEIWSLRDKLAEKYEEAAGTAVKRVKEISHQVFEEMVFQSSAIEGTLEVETVMRIFRAHHLKGLDESIASDEELISALSVIRGAALVSTGPDPHLASIATQIQSIEYYEGMTVNTSLKPLMNGDIFETPGGENSSFWILVAQECDIALRNDGKRNGDPSHMLLLKVKLAESHPNSESFELPYWPHQGGNRKAFAVLVRPLYVPTPILDLCTFNPEGQSRMQLHSPPTTFATEGSRKRYEKLRTDFAASSVKAREAMDRGCGSDHIANSFPSSRKPSLRAAFDPGPGTVSYSVGRIGSLRDPLAEAVLRTFGVVAARPALAHDLARISPDGDT